MEERATNRRAQVVKLLRQLYELDSKPISGPKFEEMVDRLLRAFERWWVRAALGHGPKKPRPFAAGFAAPPSILPLLKQYRDQIKAVERCPTPELWAELRETEQEIDGLLAAVIRMPPRPLTPSAAEPNP